MNFLALCTCISNSEFLSAPSSNSICLQPKEEGPCFALFLRYYYNKETGQCERFTYGGCGGNNNNFETQEDCEAACGSVPTPTTSVCKLEKVVGPCRANIPRFFYNKSTKRCQKFIYGGCTGNGNNFETKERCEAVCGKTKRPCCINERFSRCNAHCQRNCSNHELPSLPCPRICVSGCVCKKGLVRDSNGDCISPRNCPSGTSPTLGN
ncbi:hypothetical protein NPIL_322983 [Nephila pilipes]|uniref:BPTI/Kunitz inhibitor domain-containing protein n=1 Tax=Nephila pilipes TaxID=299642 RepID=A0A8X6UNI0_NEPPI|nr:hypothetical protein NPIL_322983 [Nephila pilipes]